MATTITTSSLPPKPVKRPLPRIYWPMGGVYLTPIHDAPNRERFLCDTPDRAADYWRQGIPTMPGWNPDVETFVVLALDTRRRIAFHNLVSQGTHDTILVHPREVFRPLIVGAASACILMHNHPSGDPQPSEADIRVTRDLIRAGELLKIEVMDHVIMGTATPNRPKDYTSLRECGFFWKS